MSRLAYVPTAEEQRRFNLRQNERDIIEDALEYTEGRSFRAAVLLGICLSTFYKKLQKHGLTAVKFRAEAAEAKVAPQATPQDTTT